MASLKHQPISNVKSTINTNPQQVSDNMRIATSSMASTVDLGGDVGDNEAEMRLNSRYCGAPQYHEAFDDVLMR